MTTVLGGVRSREKRVRSSGGNHAPSAVRSGDPVRDRRVDRERFRSHRGRIAAAPQELLKAGPRAIAEAKALIREVAFRRVEDVQRYTVERIAEVRASPEGQEGMRAFLEKRKPYWVP